MLKIIIGPDSARVAARAEALAKYPLREVLRADEVSIEALSLKASESTLFGDTRAYIADGEIAESFVQELLFVAPQLIESPHLFVFETEGTAALNKALEKTKGEIIKVKALPKEKTFDVFSLANAYAKRDRKKLWLLLREAEENNTPAEALVGILAWKARTELAGSGAKDPTAVARSSALVCMYHDAHRGEGDLSLLLERFVLNL
ncbi:MAG: hypothetical protein K2Y02_01435 [Burkholderiaceae bacterium]|nr:hypothetical protein [Burkholderiaceae bacterium]